MFKNAVNAVNNSPKATKTARTANGAVTHSTSTDKVLDLFSVIGSARNMQEHQIQSLFDAAYYQNPRLALQTLLWVRDAREGAGERKTSYTLLRHIERTYPTEMARILPVLAEFGRFDDLLQVQTKKNFALVAEIFAEAIASGNALAAKWSPREYKMKRTASKVNGKIVRGTSVDKNSVANKARTRNNMFAALIAEKMCLTMPEYRRKVSELSKTVEQLMCAQKWDEIDFGKLPTHAAKQYVEAFKRNNGERYEDYLEALADGKAKVNSSTAMPHEVIRLFRKGDNASTTLAQGMWDALPALMAENDILPMIDTSGSMSCPVGGSPNLRCMDVAIALGLYVSTKQSGAFKNMWLNFDTTPKLRELEGTKLKTFINDLYVKYNHDWGGSTDIQAAFDRILEVAVRKNVPQEQMPKSLLILSDMEFNQCGKKTNYEVLRKKYKAAGYEVPNVIFWNLKGRPGNSPVTSRVENTAMVSGFNPQVLKAVLSGEQYDPMKAMLDTIDAERYRVLGY